MTLAPIDLIAPAVPWAALAVIMPLAGAILAALLGARAAQLALPAAVAGIAIASLAAVQVAVHGPVDHAVGGWAAPLGIRLHLDGLAAAFLITTAIVTGAVAWFALTAYGSAAAGPARATFSFWPLLFSMWAGLNAVFVGADLFNLYVALELLTLTAVALVAFTGKPDTLAAATRYLLFALLGSLGYLLGVVLLYAAHGTLDMQLLKQSIRPDRVGLIAGALMTAGLMAKTALFPLHAWLPPAHAAAPAPASAMLSALVVKASFYLIARLWFDVLPALATVELTQVFGALGAGGIVLGSILALRQKRLKLVIAYSTVAQLGYLFLIFPLAGGAGEPQPWAAAAWTGGIFHALSHALAKGAMFLAAGLMIQAIGHDRLHGLTGIGRTLPVAAFAFGLASVSLMGLPPSGGFTAKYLLLTSALASGQWWWVGIIIGGGLLAAAYLFRVMNGFLRDPKDAMQEQKDLHEQSDRKDAVPVARSDQFIALALASSAILLGFFSLIPYELLQIGRSAAAIEGLQ